MNKKYFPIHKMLPRFNDFVTSNQTKLEAIPLVWEVIDLILKYIPKLEAAKQAHNYDFKGITTVKRLKKADLANSLHLVMNLIYNDCLKTGNQAVIRNFKDSESNLGHISNAKLVSKAKNTIAYCDDLGENLTTIGVTPEMLATLKADALAFEAAIPQPQESIKKGKIATEQIKTYSTEVIDIFNERLNRVMESYFKESEPDLYRAYLLATERENAVNRKLAVRGTIFDHVTNKPITRALIHIPATGIKHLCNNTKGGFRIKNLEAGTYQVEVSAVNYQTQTLTLVHHPGETNILDILLEPALILHSEEIE